MNNQNLRLSDMYSSNESEVSSVISSSPEIKIKRKGTANEITVENEKFLVSDPTFLDKIQRIVNDLQKKISILEQNSRSQASTIFQMERNIQKLKQELDKKISYE